MSWQRTAAKGGICRVLCQRHAPELLLHSSRGQACSTIQGEQGRGLSCAGQQPAASGKHVERCSSAAPHLTRVCENLAASLSSVWGGVTIALLMYCGQEGQKGQARN